MLPTGGTGVFLATVFGLAGGIAIGMITEYYTAEDKKPAQGIARQSETGAATNIIAGLGLGMKSTALPIIVLGVVILVAYKYAGLYGIGIAALGMLSTTGIQLAVDAYGPIADNAGGISEMAGLGAEVRSRTDKLDAVGNTTAAIGKGFAIGSAALTALAMFSAYQHIVKLETINLLDPTVLVGLFVGAMLPFLFSSFAMDAVGRAAFSMIEEVRRQFREIPGLMEGTATADFRRCVDISTAAAIKEMIVPGLMAVLAPGGRRLPGRHPHAGRPAGGRHRQRRAAGPVPVQRRRRLGQRQEAHRGAATSGARAATPTRPPWWATPWATPSRTPRAPASTS